MGRLACLVGTIGRLRVLLLTGRLGTVGLWILLATGLLIPEGPIAAVGNRPAGCCKADIGIGTAAENRPAG